MSRYVFFNSDAQDDKVLTAAKKAARSHGATVVKSLAGTMLLELAPAQVPNVVQALPGWRYAVERKTARVPERKPLERAKARGTQAAAAKG
jgi:ribosome modulation factor